MDSATIRQSHKHPTLCTVAVDGYSSNPEGTNPSARPQNHWRLPNTDPRNEGKYMFRLHTLDIYFWKAEDAHKFVAAAKDQLEAEQVEILDAPSTPPSHEQAMSPVVQQLENIAVQDPAYHNGQTRNSRTTSTEMAGPQRESGSRNAGAHETPKAPTPAVFQPLAYNPAAPPAPEPIKHREKTPPPVDAEEGTGLAGAAYRDHTQSMSPNSFSRPPYGQPHGSQRIASPQHPQSYSSSSGSQVPPAGLGHTSPFSSAQGQRTASVSSLPPPPPQSGRGSVSPYTPTPSFALPPQNHQGIPSQHSQQTVPSFSPPPQYQSQLPFYRKDSNPPESPATEILGNSYVSGVRQPLQHLQPQYANYTPSPHRQEPEKVGGFSNYQYDEQQPDHHHHHHHHQQPQVQGSEYDVHSQVYRPTPEEASKYKPPKASTAAPGSPAGRVEQGAGKVDKKVNSLFKRLEKRIG